MKTMLLSEFKAKCIGVMNEALRTHEPIVVTRRGHPIARIEPLFSEQPERTLGTRDRRMRILGDIVHADFSTDWESVS